MLRSESIGSSIGFTICSLADCISKKFKVGFPSVSFLVLCSSSFSSQEIPKLRSKSSTASILMLYFFSASFNFFNVVTGSSGVIDLKIGAGGNSLSD